MATRTGSELTGLAVVTLTGGERLGRLHDVVFDAPSGRVTGFLVDGGGMFSKPRFLPSGQVRSVGNDALTISSADALGDSNPAQTDAATLEARSLEGHPVLSAGGSVLGKVADIVIDTDALTVAAFLVSTGMLQNVLHGKAHLPMRLVQTIGKDSIVVPDSYDPGAAEFHGDAS